MADNDLVSAGDVIDKTLFALQDINVYPGPDFTRPAIATVKKGQPVGTVYSYLDVDPYSGRKTLWWMFYPASNYGEYYYAPHAAGLYDMSRLREQGVMTVLEKIEKEREEQQQQEYEDKPWYEKLFNWGSSDVVKPVITGAIVLAGIYVGVKYILPEIMNAKKKAKEG